MKVRTINVLIYIILILGIYGAGNLVFHEFLEEGTCPKLGIIPACYVILVCFVIPLITHFLSEFSQGIISSDTVTLNWNIFYFLFAGFALALATYATIGQLLGKIQCPKTEEGIPMCYISFVIFLSLVLLKMMLMNEEEQLP